MSANIGCNQRIKNKARAPKDKAEAPTPTPEPVEQGPRNLKKGFGIKRLPKDEAPPMKVTGTVILGRSKSSRSKSNPEFRRLFLGSSA